MNGCLIKIILACVAILLVTTIWGKYSSDTKREINRAKKAGSTVVETIEKTIRYKNDSKN